MNFDKNRATFAFLGSFLFTIIIVYTHPQLWHKSGDYLSSHGTHQTPSNDLTSFLKPHVGDSEFHFTRKYISVRHGSKPDNRSLPALSTPFNPHFLRNVDATAEDFEEEADAVAQKNTIQLELPTPQYRDHKAQLMFGLATDIGRLRGNLPHMRLWMRHKGTSVLALVPPDGGAKDLEEEWQGLGIDITIIERDASFFDRLLSLIPDMLNHSETRYGGRTEWYTILDDDTFVPSVARFASTLAGYDHERPFYIGGISEPKADLSGIGYFAYGKCGPSGLLRTREQLFTPV